MYLVDTSVWIDYFRDRSNPAITHLQHVLDADIPFGITGMIYQEILQGAASIKDFNNLNSFFMKQHFFYPQDKIMSYQFAAKIYFDCRRKGKTVRSTADCLIAQIAIENNAILLHNDIDFIHIRNVFPKLRLYKSEVI